MARKNECYLCGGKLRRGVCVECGLDNARMTRRNYRLNVTTPAHIKQKQVAAQRAESMKYAKEYKAEQRTLENLGRDQARNKAQNQRTIQAQRTVQRQRTTQRYNTASGKYEKRNGGTGKVIKIIGIVYAVLMIIAALGSCVSDFIDDISYSTPEYSATIQELEIPEVSTSVNWGDDYTYVERELSENGEYYEAELSPGYYQVGVHIPEGAYTIQITQGTYGSVWLNDDENSIYMSLSFGEDEEYMKAEDIRLYDGAYFEISGDVRLTFISENAQTDALTGMENLMDETAAAAFTAEDALELVVGEDIPAGFYDIRAIDGWASVCTSYMGESDYSYDRYFWIDSDTLEDSYQNVILIDGMTVSFDYCEVQFTPSEWIPTEDYDSYYKEYFFY